MRWGVDEYVELIKKYRLGEAVFWMLKLITF